MIPRIVIPVRPPEEGKTRLADVLSPRERAALTCRLFDHVLGVAVASGADCFVISRSAAMLDRAAAAGAAPILEEGHDLNAALAQAASVLPRDAPVLSLSSDLPLLADDDLAALATASASAAVVVATDTAGLGTNALLLARPGLIPYRYGPGSLAAHCAEAATHSLSLAVLQRPGLARDIDTPADLSALKSLG